MVAKHEQQGLTRKELEPFIGSRARVSEIMAGKRQLTLAMIRKLSGGWASPLMFGLGAVNRTRQPPLGVILGLVPRTHGAARRKRE
jgi:Helix-turn-helix